MKKYVKEFPLRLEEADASELDKIMGQIDSNQSDAVRYIIQQFRSQERQLGSYKLELAKTQKELEAIKSNLKAHFQTTENLKMLTTF